MPITLNQLGQIGLPVDDVDKAEQFYAQALGLRKLYRYGNLLFFDCVGVRLLLEKTEGAAVHAEWFGFLLSHAGHLSNDEGTPGKRSGVFGSTAFDRGDGGP